METSYIAKIYARKIKNGEMSLEEVPEKWREEVKRLLGE